MTYDPNDPYRANLTDDEIRRQARFNSLDNEVQPDPELAGPASATKVAMFAVAVAVVLGALFYGLNNTSMNQASTTSPTQTAQQSQSPNPAAAPPGMRDVTPKPNSQPGVTTGAAPTQPGTAPSSDMNKPAAPPAGNAK